MLETTEQSPLARVQTCAKCTRTFTFESCNVLCRAGTYINETQFPYTKTVYCPNCQHPSVIYKGFGEIINGKVHATHS
jgi:hypothetical protein